MTKQTTQGDHAQKPTRKALFNLLRRGANGPRVICADLTFSQATSLLMEIPETLVKFNRMEVSS